MYPPDTVLTVDEVAAWLKISRREVLRKIPCSFRLGHKTPRWLARDVLAHLEQLKHPKPILTLINPKSKGRSQ